MRALYRYAKFQAPLTRWRSGVSALWRAGFSLLGVYRPLARRERAYVAGDAIPFKGDVPHRAGSERYQQKLVFAEPRPLVEEVENLVVTPQGGGWKGGRLYERYSSASPGLRMIFSGFGKKPVETLSNAYFIQSVHPATYGDWTAEYLSALANIAPLDAPLLLPKNLYERPYVRRDIGRMGLDVIQINEPIRIRDAKVIRQQMMLRYWEKSQIEAMRRLLRVTPAIPDPGSVLYLSRNGERSEIADRHHPHDLVEEIVKRRGGKVLRTCNAALEDYIAMGKYAETVVMDHGSAGYNMIYWKPRRVIELVSDDWWMNAFLFFSNAIGVNDYTIICTDRGDHDSISARINAAFDAPFVVKDELA